MKKMNLLIALLFNALASLVLAPVIGVSAMYVFGGLFALSMIPMPVGALMAIQKEIWINDIVGNLFKANPFLNFAMNADQFVLAGKVVHIPNAGTAPTVSRNRSSLPATVVQRADVDIYFNLDEYTSDPILVPNAEEYELSYDKRQSVLREKQDAIAELMGDWILKAWAPTTAAQMVRTTGSAVVAHVDSATGNRKAVTVADIKSAQLLMNKHGIPAAGRYAILDANMYDQLTGDLTATQYRDFSASLDVANGVVGKLYGFTFLEPRATVLRYTAATPPVPLDPDALGTTTHHGGGLLWQQDAVIRAIGETKIFEQQDAPEYYGTIISALLRAGGRKRRNDAKGVVALVQEATT